MANVPRRAEGCKHIYVEKPLWPHNRRRPGDGQAGEKYGQSNPGRHAESQHSLYQKAKEMVDQGQIGDIHYVAPSGIANSLETIRPGAT